MATRAVPIQAKAVDAPTQFVDVDGRRLAYHLIGEGRPIRIHVSVYRRLLDRTTSKAI